MKKATNTPHRIDDYLQRIEEREKSARRKKMVVAGLGAFSLVAAAGLYFILNGERELRKYSIQELSKEIVTEIFDDSESRIVVAHALGTDTIENINEYQSLVDLFDGSDVQPAFFQGSGDEQEGFDDESENTPAEILQKFSIDISGNRVAGNQLVFTIEDYDPEVEYTLSFGTGYKRKVGRVSRYTYNGYGTYRMRLLASASGRGSSIYTKSIQISRAPASSFIPEREVIADASTSQVPEKPTDDSNVEIVDGATRNIEDEEGTTDDNATASDNTSTNTNVNEVAEDLPVEEEPDANKEEETNTSADLLTSEAERLEDTVTEYSGPAPVEKAPAPDPNAPLIAADIMPEFPGGNSGLKRYFVKNYTYPRIARDKGIEGTVFVRFVVNPDGSVSNISILKGLGYGCDDEAIRLVRNMPKWIPGEQDGKRVAIFKTMPIGFKLFN